MLVHLSAVHLSAVKRSPYGLPLVHRGRRHSSRRSQINIFVHKVDPVWPIWPKIGTGKQLDNRNKPAEAFL
jgi:hypothetical protein